MLGFAIAGAGLLAVTKYITKEQIEINHKLMLLKSFNELVPEANYDNDPATDIKTIKPDAIFDTDQPTVNFARKNSKIITVFLRPVAKDGYSGRIHLLVAVNRDKSLAGVRVLRHKETPGLGDGIEIRKSDWIDGFKLKSLTNPIQELWKVKKDKGEFDQFTGATITPRAIVKTVKNTLLYVEQNYQELFDEQ